MTKREKDDLVELAQAYGIHPYVTFSDREALRGCA